MPQRLPRRDHYGAPLPELTDAYREVLAARPSNTAHRRHISAILENVYQTLLRRDIHAEVTLSFTVVGGIIQADVQLGVQRQYRYVTED